MTKRLVLLLAVARCLLLLLLHWCSRSSAVCSFVVFRLPPHPRTTDKDAARALPVVGAPCQSCLPASTRAVDVGLGEAVCARNLHRPLSWRSASAGCKLFSRSCSASLHCSRGVDVTTPIACSAPLSHRNCFGSTSRNAVFSFPSNLLGEEGVLWNSLAAPPPFRPGERVRVPDLTTHFPSGRRSTCACVRGARTSNQRHEGRRVLITAPGGYRGGAASPRDGAHAQREVCPALPGHRNKFFVVVFVLRRSPSSSCSRAHHYHARTHPRIPPLLSSPRLSPLLSPLSSFLLQGQKSRRRRQTRWRRGRKDGRQSRSSEGSSSKTILTASSPRPGDWRTYVFHEEQGRVREEEGEERGCSRETTKLTHTSFPPPPLPPFPFPHRTTINPMVKSQTAL